MPLDKGFQVDPALLVFLIVPVAPQTKHKLELGVETPNNVEVVPLTNGAHVPCE